MEEPAADGHDAERVIRGPRVSKLVRNCTRILHTGRLPFDDQRPQPALAPESGCRSGVSHSFALSVRRVPGSCPGDRSLAERPRRNTVSLWASLAIVPLPGAPTAIAVS